MSVVAANFDGAQRLANIQRLFTLAARFENSGTHLIRDFVRYVEEFEAIGSRESEGQIDQAADAVRLMTIHQAKGLEFPVVIIPDLQRLSRVATDTWVLLDRHQGLTLKVPDGRGSLVAGCTFSKFEKRHAYREWFESMRLLYVAATRAEDRLILSGATGELAALSRTNDSWLKWIWRALELEGRTQSGVVELADDLKLQLTINLADEPLPTVAVEPEEVLEPGPPGDSLGQVFPLRRPVIAIVGSSIHRFSVTQLINYQRCPRQYYFDLVLRVPAADELAIWNNAEAPEPPSNINATLKGAVIHRFCERYSPDHESEELLRQCFAEVLRLRQAQLADRVDEINVEAAIKDLLPLAQNYLASDAFRRIESARKVSAIRPSGEPGLWSELSFRLRRPLGILSGIIDKLLIMQTPEGCLEAEIIDFKTNRIRVDLPVIVQEPPAKKRRLRSAQFAFDFEPDREPPPIDAATNNIIEITARDYQLQMQAYAHAVRELVPSLANSNIRVTLHFLDPNVEIHLSDELLDPARCARSIDEAMMRIVTSADPAHFPVKTAPHCRMCNFLRVCTAGREYLRCGSAQGPCRRMGGGPLPRRGLTIEALLPAGRSPAAHQAAKPHRGMKVVSHATSSASPPRAKKICANNGPRITSPAYGHNQILRRRRVRRLPRAASGRLWSRHRRAPGDLRHQLLHPQRRRLVRSARLRCNRPRSVLANRARRSTHRQKR